MSYVQIRDTKAVLLVGGLGTRLRSVMPSSPKVLATLGQRSFLELLIRQLRFQGIHRLVLCTGYLAEQVEEAFGNGEAWDVSIEYSAEPKALGTAGAVKWAQRHLEGISDFFVMNGDSFIEIDFQNLMNFHQTHGAMATIAVLRMEDTARYGTVHVDASGRVTEFTEKTGRQTSGLVNGGVYVFNQSVLQYISDQPVSLEKDVFPQLVEHDVYGQEQHGMFIDIGTPADYERARQLCDSLNEAALRRRVCDSIAPSLGLCSDRQLLRKN